MCSQNSKRKHAVAGDRSLNERDVIHKQAQTEKFNI